jgi:outer membrane protein TolC
MEKSPRRGLLPPLAGRLLLLFIVCLATMTPAVQAQLPPAAPDLHPPPPPLGPLTLEDCVRIGLERQPALNAARASLASAQDQLHALENLRFASLVSRELPVRKQQAALGVSLAAAGVEQAEHETVYAVTRNYFSALYAFKQARVVREVLDKLGANRETAAGLLKVKGDPDIKVTPIDVSRLDVYIDLYTLRLQEAEKGIALARAALREAMGLAPDCPLRLLVADLPPVEEGLDRCRLTDLALARRGEMVSAATAAQLTDLEVTAQGKSLRPTFRTFAAVSDIHSRPIPQGISNREYRPGAIGLDMPTTLAGRRPDRVQRARDLSARAAAVVDKTTNLIALETEAAYLKWRDAADAARRLAKTVARAREIGEDMDRQVELRKSFGEDVIRARTLQEQVLSQYNEALYRHALALAGLERITAGGFVPAFRAPLLRQHP